MGFFKGFFKIPKADVIPTLVTFGGYEVTKGTLQAGVVATKQAVQGLTSIHANAPPALPGSGPGGIPTQSQITYQAPSYYAPSYGGGGSYFDSYTQQPVGYPQGVSPWDYSTMFSQRSITPYPAYSAAPPARQDRTWEDLVLGALPFFL